MSKIRRVSISVERSDGRTRGVDVFGHHQADLFLRLVAVSLRDRQLKGKISSMLKGMRTERDKAQAGWVNKLFVQNARLYVNVLEAIQKEGSGIAKDIGGFLRDQGLEGCSILDVPSGTGRVGIPLATEYKVTGIDISPYLVSFARRKAEKEGVGGNCQFLVGNMWKLGDLFKPDRTFDAAINVFTSIGYGSVKDDMDFFRGVNSLLRRNGFFIIHTLMNRDYLDIKFAKKEYIDAGKLMVYETRRFDAKTAIVHTDREFYRRVKNGFELAGKANSRMRIYYPGEVVCMLKIAGFEVLGTFNNLAEKKAVSPDVMRFAVVARSV